MYHIEVIETYAGFLSLKPEWDDLLSRSDMDVPFMTHEWLDLWQKYYCKDGELLILVARDEEGVAGIVPLKKERMKLSGLSVNAVKFMANYTSCRAGILTDGRHSALFGSVLDCLSSLDYKYDLLCLDMVETDSFTDTQIKEEIQRRGIKYREIPGTTSHSIKINSDWGAYLKQLSKKQRSHFHNKENAIGRAGVHETILYKDGDLQKPLSEMMEISRRSWKHPNKAGVAGSQRSISFYTELVTILSKMKWLNIWILYLEHLPVSFTLSIEYKDRIYAIQTGYDQSFHKYSPGFISIMRSIKDAHDRGLKEFDIGDGEDPYKLKLMQASVNFRKYFIFSNTFRGKLLGVIENVIVRRLNALKNGVKCLRSKQ